MSALLATPEDGFETINRIVELIRLGLKLDQGHVVTYNQLIPIPPDDGLFVAVGILDETPYGGTTSYVPGVAEDGVTPLLLERQSLNVREIYSIHFMSRNNEARRRRADFTFALTNVRAEQSQERYSYQIATLPLSVSDASINEGAARLNRYVMTLAVLSARSTSNPVPFFDNFAGTPAVSSNQ